MSLDKPWKTTHGLDVEESVHLLGSYICRSIAENADMRTFLPLKGGAKESRNKHKEVGPVVQTVISGCIEQGPRGSGMCGELEQHNPEVLTTIGGICDSHSGLGT